MLILILSTVALGQAATTGQSTQTGQATVKLSQTVAPPPPPPANCGDPGAVCAVDCTSTAVQTAINTAIAGDTVILPACPQGVTWTSGVNVLNKTINIIGQGIDQTLLIDNIAKSPCNINARGELIYYSNALSNNSGFRMSGFTVQELANDTGNVCTHIRVISGSHSFRADHISFTNLGNPAGTGTVFNISGDTWGVVDHVEMYGRRQRLTITHLNWKNVGASADNSWATPTNFGTNEAMYMEDIRELTTASSGAGLNCEKGARCVLRNSVFPTWGTHGTDSNGRDRSLRWIEIYNNQIQCNATSGTGAITTFRGGTAMIWGNNVDIAGTSCFSALMGLILYRNFDPYPPWGPGPSYFGACDGTGPFDQNDPQLYATGTAAAGSSTDNLMVAGSSPNWTTDQWKGYSLRNATNSAWTAAVRPWGSLINGNTANTITTEPTTEPAVGASVHVWTAGDTFEIRRAYDCIDGIGRGMGAMLSGGQSLAPASPPTCSANAAAVGCAGGTSGWLNQALEPIYAWSNIRDRTQPVRMVTVTRTWDPHVVENHDFYNDIAGTTTPAGIAVGLSSAMPSSCTAGYGYWASDQQTFYQCGSSNNWVQYYKPYVYPHPLTLVATLSRKGHLIETGDGHLSPKLIRKTKPHRRHKRTETHKH